MVSHRNATQFRHPRARSFAARNSYRRELRCAYGSLAPTIEGHPESQSLAKLHREILVVLERGDQSALAPESLMRLAYEPTALAPMLRQLFPYCRKPVSLTILVRSQIGAASLYVELCTWVL